MFVKAAASDADLISIDLEDAVGIDDKDMAREETMSFLKSEGNEQVSVRINQPDTEAYHKDVAALAALGKNLPFVMVPKVDTKAEIEALNSALPENCGTFFPVIESAIGMLNAADIFSHERITRAVFGAFDFSADIASTRDFQSLLFARSHLVICAAAHKVSLFDVPHIEVKDMDGLAATTAASKNLGIYARAAVHPSQIEVIHQALAPSTEEIDWAHRVMESIAASKGNVALMDGKMIEAPIVRRAERILASRKT